MTKQVWSLHHGITKIWRVLKKRRVLSVRHSTYSLFAECGHKNTRRTIDTRRIASSPSARRKTLRIYMFPECQHLSLSIYNIFAECIRSQTRCLPVCLVSARDTRQNLNFFLPLGFKSFSLVLNFSYNMWYSMSKFGIF
jgi:hypothetical protein